MNSNFLLLPGYRLPLLGLMLATLSACGGSADSPAAGLPATTPGSVLDTSLPFVTRIDPANNAVGIDTNPRLVVGFSEEMAASRINNSTFTLSHAGIPVPGTVVVVKAAASFVPYETLQTNTLYTVRISRNVTDLAGNGLSGNEGIITPNDFVWQFTTAALPFPTFRP